MSNPNSPSTALASSVPEEDTILIKPEKEPSANGTSTVADDMVGNGGNDNDAMELPVSTPSTVLAAAQAVVEQPPELPEPLEVSEPQQIRQQAVVKKKPAGILSKSSRRSTASPTGTATVSVSGGIELKLEPGLGFENAASSATLTPAGAAGGLDLEKGAVIGVTTPSIVKPRRPSVHFAVGDHEHKPKLGGVSALDRPKQDSGGGGSRKHRSRKEKLVCRSESPTTDLSVDPSQARPRSSTVHPASLPMLPVTSVTCTPTTCASGVVILQRGPSTSVAGLEENAPKGCQAEGDKLFAQAATKMRQPAGSSGRATSSATKDKPRVKRNSTSTVNRSRGSGGTTSRKKNQNSTPVFGGRSGGIIVKELPVKKKRVIEIVSPRKRKMDHFDIVKTSSDPIFIRATKKPFKLKNKSRQNRLKFSKMNINKSSPSTGGLQRGSKQQRVRRPSSASQQSSSSMINKQRYNSGSPQKKERETESPTFPPTLTDDLLWIMEEAEKVFSSEPERSPQIEAEAGFSGSTNAQDQLKGFDKNLNPPDSDVVPTASSISPTKRLTFGRRRIESEPTGGAIGFDIPPAPNSPSASQSCYHIRKEIYFSPSPQYTTTGPTGRRRYSRRRHAKIHPPFDDAHCSFQGHHCPNYKVKGSQFCEKHLDQGPTSGYSHCRYMKDGRQCGILFPNDPTMTFCEQHASLVAKTEYSQRHPKVLPSAAKSIIAKISTIFNEGLFTPETSHDAITPDILQLVEEPDIIQEMSLGNFTGGLLEELDTEGERNVNPDKPDYDALKNAGYFTTEEIIQIHVSKLKKLKALYQREKELEWLTRQHKLRFYKEGLEKLRQYNPRFTTNPYLINKNTDLPKDYLDHQIKQYDAAKAILQTAYKADGSRGLLRLKMLQKAQELARIARASGQKQNDVVAETYDSDTDADSDTGEPRDRRGSSRFSGYKLKCAYNEGYAVRACQNHPVYWSQYCYKHILSDPKQVQWVPCNRRIGPDPSDVCKTPCFRVLEKHGCAVHSPLVMSKHKPLRRSEEELHMLVDTDNEEEDVTLEGESVVLANLVSDECLGVSHLDEAINRVTKRGPLEITDTSDSEETDEEGVMMSNLMSQTEDEESPSSSQHSQMQA